MKLVFCDIICKGINIHSLEACVPGSTKRFGIFQTGGCMYLLSTFTLHEVYSELIPRLP